MRQGAMIRLVALFLVGLLVDTRSSGAQEASPASSTLPAGTAPFGLGHVVLPTDTAGISALFGRLPDLVASEPRIVMPEQGDRLMVGYGTEDPGFGPPLSLQALNFAAGDFFPRSFTAGDFATTAISSADYGATSFGQDGSLVWVRAESTGGVSGDRPGTPTIRRAIFTVAWGETSSPWLFSALSVTPEGLDALVAAFVAAAEQPGTPAPDATPRVAMLHMTTREQTVATRRSINRGWGRRAFLTSPSRVDNRQDGTPNSRVTTPRR